MGAVRKREIDHEHFLPRVDAASLAGLDSIASATLKQGQALGDNAPIVIAHTIDLNGGRDPVREGAF